MLTPSATRLQALAEMVDSVRTRQCDAVRTGVLLKAVLGAEVADEAELTGDLAKWEEHCASVKHAPCNRSWHSLQPRVGHSLQPDTWHSLQPHTWHSLQPHAGHSLQPYVAGGGRLSARGARPVGERGQAAQRQDLPQPHARCRRRHAGAIACTIVRRAIAVVHIVRTRFDARAATQCILGCNPVHPDCTPTHASSPRARRLHPCA